MSNKSKSKESLGPLERGRGRYQQKDYSGALEAFTQAVNESTEFLLLNALDHRAAVLEKLERLQPALKDSKRMIDLKPELSKGYLRCGKILQLKGENELALKIYERGLSKVKIGTDDQRALLQKMFNKLRNAQGLGKVYDPMEFLPLELAQMVCRHLTMRDRVICLAVTKVWKKVLESMHDLWTTLDTTYARAFVKKQSLKAYAKRSNYTIDRAIISTRASFDAYKMQYLTRTCKKLRTLELCGSGLVGASLTDALPDAHNLEVLAISRNCEISFRTVRQALKMCQRSLTEASFLNVRGMDIGVNGMDCGRLETLKSIELRTAEGSILNVDSLVKATPNIEAVILMGWSLFPANFNATQWERLQHLNLSDTKLNILPKLPETVKHLYINDNYHLGIEDGEVFNLPLLETLGIRGCLNLSSSGLFALTNQSIKNGNLKCLEVGGRLHDSRISVNTLYPPSESLEILAFDSMIVGDKDIMAVVDLYPNLKRLSVHGTKVSGVGMRYIVNRGIRYVNVSQCEELGEDAVLWARGQGVEVEWRLGYLQVSGRYRDTLAGFH